MSSLNKILLIGRLGKDPVSRSMSNGGEVVSFSLATSETWKRDGEKQERTTWHNVVIFNEHLAKIAMNYLKKGSQVYLEGAMQSREYDKDGQTHRVYEVVLQRFNGELTMLDGRSEGGSQSTDNGQAPAPSNSGFDDDMNIPF